MTDNISNKTIAVLVVTVLIMMVILSWLILFSIKETINPKCFQEITVCEEELNEPFWEIITDSGWEIAMCDSSELSDCTQRIPLIITKEVSNLNFVIEFDGWVNGTSIIHSSVEEQYLAYSEKIQSPHIEKFTSTSKEKVINVKRITCKKETKQMVSIECPIEI